MRRACVIAALAVACAGGCRGSGSEPSYRVATGGDPERGRAIIGARHCGACHDIGGITGAHGVVGPSLDGFGRRSFIAGTSPNTPENLVHWLRAPNELQPQTAMPAVGLDDHEARAVAAYLYTLR